MPIYRYRRYIDDIGDISTIFSIYRPTSNVIVLYHRLDCTIHGLEMDQCHLCRYRYVIDISTPKFGDIDIIYSVAIPRSAIWLSGPTPPLPSLRPFLPFLPFLSLPSFSLYRSLSPLHPHNQLGYLGERCKFPSRVRGEAPAANAIWCRINPSGGGLCQHEMGPF